MRRRSYGLRRLIEPFVHIQLVFDCVFSLLNILIFYSLINSTKYFTLDLRVIPSNIGYLVLINKFRLEPAQAFPHESIFQARAHGLARLKSARDIHCAEHIYLTLQGLSYHWIHCLRIFYLPGSIVILVECFLPLNSCFIAYFLHYFFFEFASIPLFPLF